MRHISWGYSYMIELFTQHYSRPWTQFLIPLEEDRKEEQEKEEGEKGEEEEEDEEEFSFAEVPMRPSPMQQAVSNCSVSMSCAYYANFQFHLSLGSELSLNTTVPLNFFSSIITQHVRHPEF